MASLVLTSSLTFPITYHGTAVPKTIASVLESFSTYCFKMLFFITAVPFRNRRG